MLSITGLLKEITSLKQLLEKGNFEKLILQPIQEQILSPLQKYVSKELIPVVQALPVTRFDSTQFVKSVELLHSALNTASISNDKLSRSLDRFVRLYKFSLIILTINSLCWLLFFVWKTRSR